ncbi:MAG: hypothetical protein H7Y03_11845 [Chitinophagaceae bacterium]|nr:hypothetical protein [Chitinophagaceae bacterium]
MKKQPSLVFCILMDFCGYANYILPFLGEFSDMIWAPLSGLIFFISFGGTRGAFGALFNFAEEVLPFTDFIPTFTIAWIYQYYTKKKTIAEIVR